MSLPFSIDRHLQAMKSKKSSFWTKEAARHQLELFKNAAQRVPAYKAFLKEKNVAVKKINNINDLQKIPLATKQEYLRQYPLEQLCWNGTLLEKLVFTSTTGSTGAPFYFPRGEKLDLQSTVMHEFFLGNDPANKNTSTLVIICFGMGVWIGGLITYQAFTNIGRRGYPLAVICPGVNKKEIFEALKNIGPKFQQIIICGYPPFIKDIVDEAKDHGIDWKNHRVRFVFAAEAFSENFRDHISETVGIKNPLLDTVNIYGSADLGTMAIETPLSTLIRRLASKNSGFFTNLFPHVHRTPTLAQFNPLFTNFEIENGQILCTGDNTVPLIRYAIGDHGGVLTFDEVNKIAKKHGINLVNETQKAGIIRTLTELPFVYVYERADLSTKLYGAIIYPEHIKEDMHHPKIRKLVTGKFSLVTKTDKKHNEYLEVNVELKPKAKVTGALKRNLQTIIHNALINKNAEHRNNASLMPDRIKPRIVVWPHEHPIHFKPGIKQKWAKK